MGKIYSFSASKNVFRIISLIEGFKEIMVGVGQEVMWSPVHHDKFIAWGPELFLYEMGPLEDHGGTTVRPPGEVPVNTSPSCFRTSDMTQATLLATSSAHRYIKCLDVCPKADADVLLAVGQANGKVSLVTFGMEALAKEFSPASARQCNSVAWNRTEPNFLAAAFDKSKSESAVQVWDAVRPGEKPVVEFGIGETAHSVTWANAATLIAGLGAIGGLGTRSLKLIDRRDPRGLTSSSGCLSTVTKAVLGVCVDPLCTGLVASFVDSQICVWDLRNFEKPIATTTRQKNVTKIGWCPTRNSLLASLQRDSTEILLHDLQVGGAVGNEEVEPTLLERPIHPSPGNKITSFSWHPTIENRLLSISLSWNITDYTVLERITLNWFPSSNLVWTFGHRTMKVISDRDPLYPLEPDISIRIKRRCLAEYGLKPELWQNGELAEDSALKTLWYWLYTSRSLVEEGAVEGGRQSIGPHPGIVSLVSGERRSEPIMSPWVDVGSPASVRVYRSEDRSAALQLCGWRYERDLPSLVVFLERLQVEGEFTRAAAIAIFNLRVGLAMKILQRGAVRGQQPELSVVAMALSGFSGEAWRSHCASSAPKLTDPYLRATFAFLTAEPDKYDAVLNEAGISVEDRVAFACSFLSDVKLSDYLNKLSDKLTDCGDLAGLVLTGTSEDGLKLLQRYLDRTGDVQSVSLLAVRAFPIELQKEELVKGWIASYQLLLDSMRLWTQRAHFDIVMNAPLIIVDSTQLFISCNFCQKSISGQGQVRTTTGPAKAANVSGRMSSCPNCRKPLPRCAVCLVHMGTPSGTRGGKSVDVSSWFTWCQTCRHGGHTDHLNDWFSNHTECPVTGCSCRCLTLDGAYLRND